MKLMTQALAARFHEVGSQEHVKDPLVIAHYFNPAGSGDWWATEYDPADQIIFGYASIFHDWNDEWGYTSLAELEEYKGPFGLGIERDLYWKEKPASQVVPGFTGWDK